MSTRVVALVLMLACCVLSAAHGQPEGLSQNCNVTLVLHKTSRSVTNCSIGGCPPTTQVNSGDTIRVYLIAKHYDNMYAVQTAFSWPGSWTLLGQSWNCQSGQSVIAAPGSNGGSLATIFNCVEGPGSAVIGYLDLVAGSSGCLTQSESGLPFGDHVVNCEDDSHYKLTAHVSAANRGSICIGSAGVNACEPQTNWDETTTEDIALDKATGGAWGDYDNDGDQDLYVTRMDSDNVLFENNDGTLEVADQATVEDGGDGRGSAWADYDRDGDLDLYLANQDGANKLFRNNSGTSFTDVTAFPLGDAGNSQAVAWVDYNKDGKPDVFLANAGSDSIKIFRNDGSGFTDLVVGWGAGWGGAWADYDNDGDQDVFICRGSSPGTLLKNNSGTFQDVTPDSLAVPAQVAAWGDYDNDADMDLYIVVDSNSSAVRNRLMRNDLGGGFAHVTTSPLNDYGTGRGVTWVDYDNDGDQDIYVVKGNDETNLLFRNDGGGTFVSMENACLGWSGSTQTGSGWADYDDDGKVDMFLSNYDDTGQNDPGDSMLFRNTTSATSYHWLQIKLVGTSSDKRGIGARIRVKTYLNPFAAGQTNQIADVVGGGNASSQNSLIAEFGLQDASSVDSVQVKWPSGQVSNLTNQSIDQLLTITEPSPFSSSGGDHAVLMPRVTAGAAMIAYALPARNVRVSIFDVSGRVVRVIDYDRGPNGAQEVTWNWIDHRGRAVPAGVYLYRIEGGGQREFGRLLRVK